MKNKIKRWLKKWLKRIVLSEQTIESNDKWTTDQRKPMPN